MKCIVYTGGNHCHCHHEGENICTSNFTTCNHCRPKVKIGLGNALLWWENISWDTSMSHDERMDMKRELAESLNHQDVEIDAELYEKIEKKYSQK